MPETLKTLFALAGGGAIAVAAIAGFSYWLFKLFSEKWLTAKFNERLEDYKHKQQRELEELRFKINSLMDRTTKLHQREFEVLPEAWAKLVIAHANVQGLVSAFQQHPDVNRMNNKELEDLIENSRLKTWQKDELRNAPNKTEYYITASKWVRTWEVQEVFRDYAVYERKNGIFIREEIKNAFKAVSDLMSDALFEHRFELEHGARDGRSFTEIWAQRTKFSKESDSLLVALEKLVQHRLWDSQDAFSSEET
jgi:hypothetical protein